MSEKITEAEELAKAMRVVYEQFMLKLDEDIFNGTLEADNTNVILLNMGLERGVFLAETFAGLVWTGTDWKELS